MARFGTTQTIIAALVGFGAAMATTAVRSGSEPAPPSSRRVRVQAKAAPQAKANEVVQRIERARAARLARRVAELERTVDQPDQTASAPTPMTPAQAMRRVRARTATRERRHQAQRVDSTWSDEANRAIRGDLAALASRTGLDIVDVDCRTDVCRIDLGWASYEQAQSNAGHLAEDIRSLNCAIHVPLPPPDQDRTQSYQSAVYLDCARLRQSRS
jgi:hypothetical protein